MGWLSQLLAVQAVTHLWATRAQRLRASNSRPLGPRTTTLTTDPSNHQCQRIAAGGNTCKCRRTDGDNDDMTALYSGVRGNPEEDALLTELFDTRTYNRLTRPVRDLSDIIHVRMSIVIQKIVQVVTVTFYHCSHYNGDY